jgi:hypothetical protein
LPPRARISPSRHAGRVVSPMQSAAKMTIATWYHVAPYRARDSVGNL